MASDEVHSSTPHSPKCTPDPCPDATDWSTETRAIVGDRTDRHGRAVRRSARARASEAGRGEAGRAEMCRGILWTRSTILDGLPALGVMERGVLRPRRQPPAPERNPKFPHLLAYSYHTHTPPKPLPTVHRSSCLVSPSSHRAPSMLASALRPESVRIARSGPNAQPRAGPRVLRRRFAVLVSGCLSNRSPPRTRSPRTVFRSIPRIACAPGSVSLAGHERHGGRWGGRAVRLGHVFGTAAGIVLVSDGGVESSGGACGGGFLARPRLVAPVRAQARNAAAAGALQRSSVQRQPQVSQQPHIDGTLSILVVCAGIFHAATAAHCQLLLFGGGRAVPGAGHHAGVHRRSVCHVGLAGVSHFHHRREGARRGYQAASRGPSCEQHAGGGVARRQRCLAGCARGRDRRLEACACGRLGGGAARRGRAFRSGVAGHQRRGRHVLRGDARHRRRDQSESEDGRAARPPPVHAQIVAPARSAHRADVGVRPDARSHAAAWCGAAQHRLGGRPGGVHRQRDQADDESAARGAQGGARRARHHPLHHLLDSVRGGGVAHPHHLVRGRQRGGAALFHLLPDAVVPGADLAVRDHGDRARPAVDLRRARRSHVLCGDTDAGALPQLEPQRRARPGDAHLLGQDRHHYAERDGV
eukprot:ctg_1755.g495